jgi:acetyltransferase-like isoleucine patch superfamily enzyme
MARDQLEETTAQRGASAPTGPAPTGATGPTPAGGDAGATLLPARQASKLRLLLKALRQPIRAWPLLRAKWALRRCDQVGPWPRLFGRVLVRNHGRIIIGERLLLFGTTVRAELVTAPGGVLEIGDRVFINYGVSISAHTHVKIGNRCQIGNYTLILDNDYHQTGDKTMPGQARPIILEDDVWLGARVIVLKGVTIGQGAVIGAGSVVTRDIPPRSVAVGQPARVVKTF